jgi:CHAT domain-containing protein/tetratricopeptide (TPR) repeat protein
MRLFALPSALAIAALTLPLHGSGTSGGAPKPNAPPAAVGEAVERARQFVKSTDAWGAVCGGGVGEVGVGQLYAKYNELWKADRFAEARDVARALLDVRTRMNGEDHFQTRNARSSATVAEHVAALPDAARAEYAETNKLFVELAALNRQGKYPESILLSERILAAYRRLLPRDDLAVIINGHAILLNSATRYDEAEPLFREALEICRRVAGNDHPATATVRGNLAMTLNKLDRYDEARPLYEEDVAIKRRLLGEDHPDTVVATSNLVTHLDDLAKHAEVEPQLRRVLDVMVREEGKDGYHAEISRNNLAFNLAAQGRYAEAEPLYREVLESRLNPPFDEQLAAAASALARAAQHHRRLNHPHTADALGQLAVNLDSLGRYAEAEALYRQALAIYQTFDGESTRTAATYSSLAVTLDHQGRHEEAEQIFEKAVGIFLRAAKGRKGRQLARCYNNRAANLAEMGRLEEAQKLHEEALAIYRNVLEKDHPDIAASLNNLATTLGKRGKYVEAEPLFREAVEAQSRKLGPEHPHTTSARVNLALNLHHQGRHAEAGPEFEAALELHRRLLGKGHPRTAGAYKNLVANYCALGEYGKADALAEAAAESFETARLRIGFGGLDRAGGAADLSPLPGLAVAAARRGKFVAAWKALERDLARGLLDDVTARPLTGEDRRREQALLARLNVLDRRVELLRDAGPEAERKKAGEDRDAAQAELVRFQAELAARYGMSAGRVYEPDRIQKQLPEDAALLGWVDLPAEPKWHDPKGDHWACLVKRQGDPVWVQLTGSGPKGEWTEEDDQLPAKARRAFAARPDDPNSVEWIPPAARLQSQRLEPLLVHLEGVRHLIVLPSARMAGVPVEALTKRTVSYAPSGTMFAWLREKRSEPGSARPSNHLLAIGNPAFKKGADGPAPLPGTVQELAGITRVFNRTSELKGADASEQNLDRLAAEEGGLRRFGYLHFATHGVLDDRRPLRSALLLAQDSLPNPLDRVLDGKEVYDGRLTAERVLRRWKLDADLVTLSACETGLGRYSGGEGYLGFSQALFVVGARSLVLSLWEVDDAATALLMARFYENLMGIPADLPGGPVAAMPKAEALAKAKEWLRALKPDEVDQLRKDLPSRGTRGRLEKKKPAAPTAALSYDHPYYWSGFVLVGDPR